MAVYSINYDLVNPGRNYDDLINAIKSYSAWCHPLESCWLIITEQEPESIRNYLNGYMDANDKILVAKVTAPAAWCNLSKEVSDWIHRYLK